MLCAGFDHHKHKANMWLLFGVFGDGDWWADFLHDALTGYMLTEDFDGMSRAERLRRSDAVKYLSRYLREISGGKSERQISAESKLRIARAVLGQDLIGLLTAQRKTVG